MSKHKSDSQKRFAFASQLVFDEQSGLPKEIQVIPCGEWQHPYYGPMKITPAEIAEMKQNFDDGVRLDLPITAGHDNGMNGGELEAVAWYGDVIDRGIEGLFTTVKWNPEGERLLKEHAFKYFSTEFYAKYTDPQTGRVYNNVLCGGALTNRPYFKEMAPVGQFSEGIMSKDFNDNEPIPMELKDIVVIKASDLTAEQKAFLVTNKAQLTAEQKVTFKEIVGEDTPTPTPEPTPAPVTASDKVVTMSETEVNALKVAAEQGQKAMQRIEASERETVVSSLMASPTNKAGRFAEAQRDTVTGFVATLTEAQRVTFAELVKAIPTTLTFGEIGDGGGNGADAEKIADQVDKEVKALMASDKSLTALEAQNRVFAEKPDLKKQYEASLKA